MEKIKVFIVEDEALIAESLSDILEDLGYEVLGTAMRAKEALLMMESEQPDLAILDINLKGVEDGIWLAGELRKKYSFPYIFLTSFANKTTVEAAVKTKPHGYLVKPFKKVDIFSAIELALNNHEAEGFGNKNEGESSGAATSQTAPSAPGRDYIYIKEEYLFRKLPFREVKYIKSDDNYLEIHTVEKRHVIKSTMKDLLPKLPDTMFVRTHRSWVVNIEKIESLGASFVNIGPTEIPISASYKEDLLSRLGI